MLACTYCLTHKNTFSISNAKEFVQESQSQRPETGECISVFRTLIHEYLVLTSASSGPLPTDAAQVQVNEDVEDVEEGHCCWPEEDAPQVNPYMRDHTFTQKTTTANSISDS